MDKKSRRAGEPEKEWEYGDPIIIIEGKSGEKMSTASKAKFALLALVFGGVATQVPGWLHEREKKAATENLILTSQMPYTKDRKCFRSLFGGGWCEPYNASTLDVEIGEGSVYNRLGLYRDNSGFGLLGGGYTLEGNKILWTNRYNITGKNGDHPSYRDETDFQGLAIGNVVRGQASVASIPVVKTMSLDFDTGIMTESVQTFTLKEQGGLKAIEQGEIVETKDLGGPVQFGRFKEYPEATQKALLTLIEKVIRDIPYYAESRARFAKYVSRSHAFAEGIRNCHQPNDKNYALTFHKHARHYSMNHFETKAVNYPFLHPEKAGSFMVFAERIQAEYEQNPAAFEGFAFYNFDSGKRENIAPHIIAAYNTAKGFDIEAYAPAFTGEDNAAIVRYLAAHCEGGKSLSPASVPE